MNKYEDALNKIIEILKYKDNEFIEGEKENIDILQEAINDLSFYKKEIKQYRENFLQARYQIEEYENLLCDANKKYVITSSSMRMLSNHFNELKERNSYE